VSGSNHDACNLKKHIPDVLPASNTAAGEMLHVAEPFLERNLHPTVIVRGFRRALEDAIKVPGVDIHLHAFISVSMRNWLPPGAARWDNRRGCFLPSRGAP
jgi:hypothetical protein